MTGTFYSTHDVNIIAVLAQHHGSLFSSTSPNSIQLVNLVRESGDSFRAYFSLYRTTNVLASEERAWIGISN